ncbi:MAG: 3-methyl-2-oxobutanoate hydroxymethyltransferase [Deltaproteobacteria bacterium]
MKKTTVNDIVRMKQEARKIPVLTAYSFQVARILDSSGIPLILVGDSAGMVEAGYENTIPVTVDEMIYHTRSVVRGRRSALVVSDMPFASYQVSLVEARKNAARLVKEAGAEAVKLEGGRRISRAISSIVRMGIPVMGHIGLTPQSVHATGGYKVQGRTKADAMTILDDAKALEEAGVFSMVLECVPAALAKEITGSVSIPTIGIGAGPDCDGQVLVVNDMLGLSGPDGVARYVKKYAELESIISGAVREYAREVSEGAYPSKGHSY